MNGINLVFRRILIGMCAFSGIISASAATLTFTGNGDWSNTARWSTSSVPTAGDDVIISGTCTVTGATATCNTISIGSSNTLILDNTLTVVGGVTLDGTIAITSAGSLIKSSISGAGVQYTNAYIFTGNSWTTGSSWLDGAAPANGSNVVVNATYTLSGTYSYSNVVICDGSVLTIDDASSLTTTGNLVLNSASAILVASTSSGTGSLLPNAVVINGAGSVEVQRYITGSGYHYVSTPTSSTALYNTNSAVGSTYQFDEGASATWNNCWVTASAFTQGVGLAMSGTGTFSSIGTPNCSTINVPVTNSGLWSTTDITGAAPFNVAPGWNLLGNPYPSSLSATAFLADNTAKIGASYQALYLWDDPGAVAAYSTADYIAMNAAGTTGPSASAAAPTGIKTISSGQAFFVNVIANSTLQFNAAQRNISNGTALDNSILKVSSSNAINNLNLQVQSDKGLTNNICLSFLNGGSDGLDNYDAQKLIGNPNIALYSLLNNQPMAIQAYPVLTSAQKIIPVTLLAGLPGTYTFSLSNNTLTGSTIALFDALTNTTTSLLGGGVYTFSVAAADTISNRFSLVLNGNNTTGIAPLNSSNVKVYAANKTVYINLQNNTTAQATVYDMLGKVVVASTLHNAQLNTLNLQGIAPGCYIVHLVGEGIEVNQKVVIN